MNVGSCLCGDVTWEVDGTPQMMMNCHCSICRKIHGSDYVTFVSFAGDGFRWLSGEDRVEHYASTPGGPPMRAFCGRCGSKVAALTPDGSMAFMAAGNLEGEIEMAPAMHCFTGSRAPWVEIENDATQYEGFPEGYEGEPVETAARLPATESATGGSCHCDKVRYEFDMPFERMGYCHCSLCRKSMSSAMSSEVFVEREDFRYLRGEEELVRYDHPDSHFSVQFCRHCGSLMPIPLDDDDDLVLVPAGALDQDPGIRPMGHIFVGSKANWSRITDDLPRYDEWPPEVDDQR